MRGSTCDFQKGFSIRREPVEGNLGHGETGREKREERGEERAR